MSQITVHIPMDAYLAQWFVNEQGGQVPVSLGHGTVESKILETYLMKRPPEVAPELGTEGLLPIYIPTFRFRPAEVYNYLPKKAAAALAEAVRHRFDIKLWNDVHPFTQMGIHYIDELIYAWMEKHGIKLTESNYNAIQKRFQRQRRLYADRFRKKQKKK